MDKAGRDNQWIIELGENDDYWATDLESIPNMICISYRHLRVLTKDGKVYGAMLQCKDVFELICKTPLIMALIFLDENPMYKESKLYSDIIRNCLEAPMSMGSWDSLAGIIVKKQNELQLPNSIHEILRRTRKLYQAKITDSSSNVVNWRNNTIGHGVLKFENDPSYVKEMVCLLNLLKVYFDGQAKFSIKGLYDEVYFLLDGHALIGDFWSDKIVNEHVKLSLDGTKTETDHFIVNKNYKCYLFDSFYKSKKLTKYSSYIDGQSIVAANSYFTELVKSIIVTTTKAQDISALRVKREEERILEFLNTPTDYIEPKWLISELEDVMEDMGKGIISIFMERGTGKSAFANRMNGLYHSHPLFPNAFSRGYHVQNAELRGKYDFINSVNFSFRHSLDPSEDLYGSIEELPSISFLDIDKRVTLADFLNKYHRIYNKDYTVLVLDGIDEITKNTDELLDFIPTQKLLDDGVFVILLSRFQDEQTVVGQSKSYIEMAQRNADRVIEIRRKSDVNKELLKSYIAHGIPECSMQEMDSLLREADYRFLYLKALLAVNDKGKFDNTNEKNFVKSYMDYVCSFYGSLQKTKIIEIAVTFAIFPEISLDEYKKYIACQEITYEFVGLFNNLLPLMTVTHQDGSTRYEFADKAFSDYLIGRYFEEVQSIIDRFYVSFSEYLAVYLQDDGYRDFEKNSEFNCTDLNDDIVFFT